MSPDAVELKAWEDAKRAVVGRQLIHGELVELIRRAGHDHGALGDAAAYALASAPVSRRHLQFTVEALLGMVADSSLSAERRGLAAEGVGNQLAYSKRRVVVRHASLELIDHLRDPVAEVRFWSAFSLGTMKARRACNQLRALTDDPTVVQGWWAVGKEATDALATIDGWGRPDESDVPADATTDWTHRPIR